MAQYLNFISTISAATGCNDVWVKTLCAPVHTRVHLTAPALRSKAVAW